MLRLMFSLYTVRSSDLAGAENMIVFFLFDIHLLCYYLTGGIDSASGLFHQSISNSTASEHQIIMISDAA